MERLNNTELEEFFEAIETLAKKEKEDADFELMKRAVGSLWQNLEPEKENVEE